MWLDTLTEFRQFAGRLPLNVLIVGAVTTEQRAEALQELRVACGRDAYHPQRRMPFELPIGPISIVVIDEVADLSVDDQQGLLQWLERHREAIVLSFAINPVFPLVTQGKFSERLFYRLNVITLSVDDEVTWTPGNRYARADRKKDIIKPAR